MPALDDWLTLVRRGDFARAWELSDASVAARANIACWHLPRHEQWVWRGAPLTGKRVLIRCYHGLGDTLQFIRYAPAVRAIASHVIVWAQPSLIPVLQTMRDASDELLPLHDGAPDCEYDVDVEVMELAHIFRSTPDTIPREVPYLHVAPAQLPPIDAMRVGIVWRGGDWDERRDVPFALLASLADVPHVELFSLQRDARVHEPLRTLAGVDEPLSTARIMRALDLVITIDSMPAHLAGALGVRTWTLLPANCDWRWMDDREDTPWYPTMRLFRQQREGEWAPVIERVRAELRRIAADGRLFRNTTGEETRNR
jgi:hypothetical protein